MVVQDDLVSLGAQLVSAKIITPLDFQEIRNPYTAVNKRAAMLVQCVLDKVHMNSQLYYAFIDVLEQSFNRPWYDGILSMLQETLSSAKEQPLSGQPPLRRIGQQGVNTAYQSLNSK